MSDDDSHRPSTIIGQLLGGGRYRILRPIGEGGMGAVYEAEHLWTRRRVAIKLMLSHRAADANSMQRFLREARAAAMIRHPNIVEVLDMGEDQGRLYMVQELLQGRSLAAELASVGRFAPQAALDVIFPVMGALVAAHQRGILHRDIKPENIFLAREASGIVPRLIDFGIAKVREPLSAVRTATGNMMGTPAYMAPEQVLALADLDERMDVWAVGAVLFEMLSGQLPFDAPSASAIMVRIATEPAPSLCSVAPSVPAVLGDCIDRALRRDRAERHRSMRAFLGALLECPDRAQGLDGAHLRALAEKSTSGEQRAPLCADLGGEPGLAGSTTVDESDTPEEASRWTDVAAARPPPEALATTLPVAALVTAPLPLLPRAEDPADSEERTREIPVRALRSGTEVRPVAFAAPTPTRRDALRSQTLDPVAAMPSPVPSRRRGTVTIAGALVALALVPLAARLSGQLNTASAVSVPATVDAAAPPTPRERAETPVPAPLVAPAPAATPRADASVATPPVAITSPPRAPRHATMRRRAPRAPAGPQCVGVFCLPEGRTPR